MIINSDESDDTNNENDPIQKRNHHLLQYKYKKTTNETSIINTSTDTASNDEQKSDNETVNFKSMKLSSLTCLTQSLSAYLISKHNKKGSEKLRTLTIKIYDSVNLWLSRLFR